MKENHGGYRKGSGRKPTGRSNRKTLFLSDEAIEILGKVKHASEFVDSAIVFYFGSGDGLALEELKVAVKFSDEPLDFAPIVGLACSWLSNFDCSSFSLFSRRE
jgi:hypothetical protein